MIFTNFLLEAASPQLLCWKK